MGLYNYLDEYQVKCFPKAAVGLALDKDGKFKLNLVDLGGDLIEYPIGSKVPYKTPYYNYGTDFMIFDFRTFNFYEPIVEDELMVHIIRRGCYIKSVRYDKVSFQYSIDLVLDNNGCVINVKTPADFKKIVNEWRESHIQYHKLSEKYRNEKGVIDIMGKSWTEIQELKLSDSEIMTLIDANNECLDKASKETLDKFNKKWYKSVEKRDNQLNKGWPFGGLYFALDGQKISEHDKYWIARLFKTEVEKAGRNFDTALKEYFAWCISNKVRVDRDWYSKFFKKYLKDIPSEVLEEYEKSEEKVSREQTYKNLY